ncbi:fimbrial protein [Pseudomonas massiliensis]|uniref:fimbrial protein n=1 Tax=Pseudomonas massiliensis TaxID=522492 RepID=UPI0006938154|nr:fimbrial protein [Pseudomonas massiliensis]
MKRLIATAALVLASGSTFANTGTIQFRGQITSATCRVDIVDPVAPGVPTPVINLGAYDSEYFTATGQRTPTRPFGLWIRDIKTCGLSAGDTVSVTFQGQDGEDAANYLIKEGTGTATKVALAITDPKQVVIKPGVPSPTYPVGASSDLQINFNAALVSTDATVTPGAVAADVSFLVNIP